MSRKGPEIDFNPLLEKVQRDISFLSYLGLHQYAKQQRLIGRSRPMITKDMDFVMQRRLNFRLLVACIQQIVGRTHYDHGNRIEQVNYVNVGNYAQLRLYGLLDREMYALDTDADTTLTGWWPGQLNRIDVELLSSPASMDTIEEQLSYNTRATIEIGGETFLKHMRDALRFIVDQGEIAPHSQRDPRNRMRIKNLSLNLQLIETRPYETNRTTRHLPAGPHTGAMVGFVDVPCHIERLLHFRDTVWPWVQRLSTPEAKEAFKYVKQNYPGMQAVTIKIREIRSSVQETQRREREAEAARAEREVAQAQLRERLVNTYGEPDPQDEDNDGPQIEHVPGVHGGELTVPYGQIPPPEPIEAEFIRERNPIPLPDTPEFGYIEQEGGTVVLPVPDVHHGMDETIAEQANDITDRIRRALGMEEEE
ncbi:MAG: hypothetical protein KAR39_07445 [Thermoplasmata archaeon]|nr:hypothetical protein [Thermoplasmata archaeon]